MKQETAFITGGASGIGRATAEALLRDGVRVAIADVNQAALTATAEELGRVGPEILPIHADLSDLSALDETFRRAISTFGRVDYLINSAAIFTGLTADLLEVSMEEWDRVMNVNLKMPMFLLQIYARHALERGGGGRVVLVSSSGAFRGPNNRPAYGASKGGITSLVRIAAAQLGQYDINVNAVAPGVTNTPGNLAGRNIDVSVLRQSVIDGPKANFLRRVSEPEDIAATIAFLCAPGSRQITGQTIHVSAGHITP